MTSATVSDGATSNAGKLPASLKFSWGLGSLGTVSMMYLFNTMALFYMTDFLGMAAGLGGALLLAARGFDFVSDPIVGLLSDRTKTRWGRRRPWMFVGAILCGLSCMALFNLAGHFAGGALMGATVIVILVYFTGYTMFNIPYMAMPAEMTADKLERTSVMAYRVLFVSAAGIASTALAPWLVSRYGGGMAGYGKMALVMGVVVGLPMLWAAIGTGAAPATRHDPAKQNWGSWVRTAIDNKPFLYLVAAKFFQLCSLSSATAAVFFFISKVVGTGPAGVALFGLTLSGGSIISLPIWAALNKRYPKQFLYAFAVSMHAALNLTWFLAGPGEPQSIFILRCVLLGLFSGGLILMGQSLLPDAISHDFARTGLRREGAFAAIYSAAEKIAFAVGPFAIGLFLSAMDYAPSTGATVAQPQSAITAIYICMAALPAALSLISVPLIFKIRFDDPGDGKIQT